MSYQVLARKWRPKNFKQLVGQQHVMQALVNALDNDRLHHAYLFSGTRGVGKTTIARIFSKSLNCDSGIGSEPCGECSSCLEIDEGRSIDLLEIDAASRTGVDDMRELLENVQYAPTHGRFKVYLIDEVHMLSKNSFNALLKTLEEPPEHVKFLLATTDPQKLPVTVLSRCLQFNLKRMSVSQIKEHLAFILEQESISFDDASLLMLAQAADGSMRDALSLLDQAIAFGAGSVECAQVESMLGTVSSTYISGFIDAVLENDAEKLLSNIQQLHQTSPDYQRVCADVISLLYHIAVFQQNEKSIIYAAPYQDEIKRLAPLIKPEVLQLYYQIMLNGRIDLEIAPNESQGFDMLMLRLMAFTPNSADSEQKKSLD
ncbi:MAG: DNA polymerase III subunit gamma/tau [Gammaproteobacteria bacterium]|nr:DNA polymerase III subunit gamma/tau [Gammaproteobacteria bacterium]